MPTRAPWNTNCAESKKLPIDMILKDVTELFITSSESITRAIKTSGFRINGIAMPTLIMKITKWA